MPIAATWAPSLSAGGSNSLHGRFAPNSRVRRVAAVAVGEAEVEARLWRAQQFVGRHIVSHVVAPVLGEPQLARLRMPVEADGVADAAREDFEPVPSAFIRVIVANRSSSGRSQTLHGAPTGT